MKDTRISARLTAEQFDRLEQFCAAQGSDISTVVRRALDAFLCPETPKTVFLALKGVFHRLKKSFPVPASIWHGDVGIRASN
jgi:hypothetical protein